MRKSALSALVFAFILAVASGAAAGPVSLYVDAAPNGYGSPNYDAWWANAKTTAANGTFVNMENSFDPANSGSTFFELEDAVVYSFGDLGKRLHFVYWVPGETIATLTTKNFEIGFSYVWDGVSYDDYYGATWVTPSSWQEYNGGVIGTGGFAWWAAYGVNTPEAVAADLAAWRPYQGDITFRVKMDGAEDSSLTAHVPDGGATITLLGAALTGLGLLRRKFRS